MSHLINTKAILKATVFIFLGSLLSFTSSFASSTGALYEVEVLVADESADTRWRVLKGGLDEVFIRLSGDSIIMDKLKRPPAKRYVKQYSYDPVTDPGTNEQGEMLRYRMKVQYNGHSMEKYLRDNGYPVWSEHRTNLVVWMAIRDGSNEYVLKESDQSLLKAAADEALHRRGIPERWPLYDAKDRKILQVADIRGGFKDPVMMASKRYSRGPALTGSLIWNGRRWQSSWGLLMASGNRYWSIEDADYKLLINKAIDQAADAMGIVFAVHGLGNNQQLIHIQMQVQAVNSIKKYRRLENYLRELNAVVAIRPLTVDAGHASFELTLRASEAEFFNRIKKDAEIIESQPIIPAPESPPIAPVQPAESPDVSPAENTKVAAGSGNAETGSPGEQVVADTATESASEPASAADSDTGSLLPVYYYKLKP